jgi:hypothetical protein
VENSSGKNNIELRIKSEFICVYLHESKVWELILGIVIYDEGNHIFGKIDPKTEPLGGFLTTLALSSLSPHPTSKNFSFL